MKLRRHALVACGTFAAFACASACSGAGDAPLPDGGAEASAADASVQDASNEASPVDAGGGADADAGAHDAAADGEAGADTGVDAGDGGLPPPVLTLGAPNRILLLGTVVTPDIAFIGQVLVEGDLITCVAPGLGCAGQVGAAGATVIDTKGVIAPGLVDTHNHIIFDIFDDDDWLPSKVYANHDEWPSEPRYQAMLDVKQCLEDASQGKPAWCPLTYDGAGSLKCEMDKWGELKALVAGTTSVVGLAGTTSACFGSLARSLDAAQNGLGQDKIQTSALFPPSRSAADGVCANFADGDTDAYLIHVGEGTNAKALAELATLGTVSSTPGCLYAPQTTITHGTAFGPSEFAQMAAAGMKLTWSPRSNVALYGTTTNVPAALDAGIVVALAPDWSMGGSQNLLDELRFAASWNALHFGGRLADRDLVAMTTKNAAKVVGLAGKLGRVAVGLTADLMVVSPTKPDAFGAILAARPKDVRLTMVGGRILYGDAVLKAAAPATPGCEDVPICGAPKFLCVAESTTTSKLGQTYAEIKAALEAALVDVDAITPDGYDFAPLAPLVKCD
ncbi:MAG: amidohydrolase family protein [Deltaproteobacteria bacterium]|nr:amidohydrolase family protein [Deltaproteobacteria bacterium]